MTVEKRKTRIQAKNEDIIVSAAGAVFATHGYRGATVAQIAKAANMQKANVLYYFNNKEAIYTAVLERTLKDWVTPMSVIDAAGDPLTEIGNYIRQKLKISRDLPAASRLFAMELISGAPHILDTLQGEFKEGLEEKIGLIKLWIDQGKINAVDPYHLFFAIWAVTQQYADFEVQVQALSGQTLADKACFDTANQTVIDLFINGLAPRN